MTKKTDRKTPILGWKLFWVLMALSVASFAAHLALYPALPAQVPRQWALDGSVNSWTDKKILFVLWLLPAALLVLFKVIPAIEPKSDSYRKSRRMWNVFSGCFTLGAIALTWITELFLWGPAVLWRFVPSAVMAAVAVGLIALGNYMPRIRQNYTMGAKTPWALASEHCWQRTQRMAGIVFILCGILLLAAVAENFVLGSAVLVTLSVAAILLGCVWIYVYSWLVYIGKMK
ncbi:SdpI family protein [uncultured Gemmiger sp.]|uniref:SdpI family protein n=1 Tax=uncultured Gemmiger sp. TaxID=1623490 RepID=UPI0025E8C745|nr:SdpI family protein [uncultured Gemmiger sp.]